MKLPSSRNPAKAAAQWPRKIRLGRVTVSIYKRQTPTGGAAFMVANYADGKRRFDCYATEADALDAANRLARQLSERDVVAAAMTNEQAADYAAAVQTLAPFKLSLPSVASTVAECLNLVGGLTDLHAAAKFYTARRKRTVAKPVSAVVAELLAVKEARGASARYLQDLRHRLNRFADTFHKDACNVTTAEIQEWLDSQKLKPQSYQNFRRVIHLLFEFAVARGYASDNPVAVVESVEVRAGDVDIFTPMEINRLLAAASPDFLPCLALGAFAGLRSAEIERLEWSDIDLAGRHITVGADKAKTASRRVVPICNNLAAWLTAYAEKQGNVWPGGHDEFYEAQQETAAATEVKADPENGIKGEKPVKWKANALRHSYASYRFAQTGDAGRVAGELGNSAAVVHRHYRELVKPADAERWFAVKPEGPANLLALPAAANAANA
ncbi:MAG: tyrosine-type recombinase/integrase [Verrucomicrobia bacterium]|nr:tyrosine-type recombinase/integrase [Verrucomicrobiota bacterium]